MSRRAGHLEHARARWHVTPQERLHIALGGELGDPILQGLWIDSVLPSPVAARCSCRSTSARMRGRVRRMLLKYLAIRTAKKTWGGRHRAWNQALLQFAIHFQDRIPA